MVIKSFYKFMESSGSYVSRNDFEKNLIDKMKDRNFTSDIRPLIRPDVRFDNKKAFDLIMSNLIQKLS